ncbi:MAG TPA: hypothetical protein VF400_15875 [Anaeromyxobacteraceae bacterium]
MRASIIALHLALLAFPAVGDARGSRSTGTGIQEVERELRDLYQRSHACPSTGKTSGTCPGYVVGYVLSPRRGGTYQQSNLRWMTLEDAERAREQDQRW